MRNAEVQGQPFFQLLSAQYSSAIARADVGVRFWNRFGKGMFRWNR